MLVVISNCQILGCALDWKSHIEQTSIETCLKWSHQIFRTYQGDPKRDWTIQREKQSHGSGIEDNLLIRRLVEEGYIMLYSNLNKFGISISLNIISLPSSGWNTRLYCPRSVFTDWLHICVWLVVSWSHHVWNADRIPPFLFRKSTSKRASFTLWI